LLALGGVSADVPALTAQSWSPVPLSVGVDPEAAGAASPAAAAMDSWAAATTASAVIPNSS
jgi:hypothetical protein